jgi:hypothetical protein
MTDAEKWVRENSEAKGSAWWFMLTLAARAEGCIALSTAEQLIEGAKISRRELYRVLLAQCQSGELERVSKQRDPKPLRAFHFAKMNCAKDERLRHPLCPCKQSTVPDLRKRMAHGLTSMRKGLGTDFPQEMLKAFYGVQLPLLPEIHEAAYRAYRGEEPPRWRTATSVGDDLLFRPVPVETRHIQPPAKQLAFEDVIAEQKRQKLQEWVREHAEVKPEAPRSNVVVFQRRTA